MTPEQRLEVLHNFLVEHNVYAQYYSNVQTRHAMNETEAYEYILQTCNSNECRLLMTGVFRWNTTPEDHLFWSDICKKWEAKFK